MTPNIVIAVVLVIAAHVLRDGTPRLGSSMLARACAAFLCLAAGAIAHDGALGALLGVAVGAGFWTDRKHAEGQRAQGWRDAGWLSYSGITSLAPFAAAAAVLLSPWHGAIALLGLVKVPLWFVAARTVPHHTRTAAGAFGAVVGCVLTFAAVLS